MRKHLSDFYHRIVIKVSQGHEDNPPCACSSCVRLSATLWDVAPAGSSVHGISQARILEWVAISSSRRSSRPKDLTHVSCVSCTGRRVLYHWATWADQRTPEITDTSYKYNLHLDKFFCLMQLQNVWTFYALTCSFTYLMTSKTCQCWEPRRLASFDSHAAQTSYTQP